MTKKAPALPVLVTLDNALKIYQKRKTVFERKSKILCVASSFKAETHDATNRCDTSPRQVAATNRLVWHVKIIVTTATEFRRCDLSHKFKLVWIRATYRSDKLSASDLSQQQCRRGDLSPRRVAAICRIVCLGLKKGRHSVAHVLKLSRYWAIFWFPYSKTTLRSIQVSFQLKSSFAFQGSTFHQNICLLRFVTRLSYIALITIICVTLASHKIAPVFSKRICRIKFREIFSYTRANEICPYGFGLLTNYSLCVSSMSTDSFSSFLE